MKLRDLLIAVCELAFYVLQAKANGQSFECAALVSVAGYFNTVLDSAEEGTRSRRFMSVSRDQTALPPEIWRVIFRLSTGFDSKLYGHFQSRNLMVFLKFPLGTTMILDNA